MASSAYYTSDDVILRSIKCTSTATPKDKLVTVYEINRCISWIQQAGHKKVALQFPDNLLVDAPSVAAEIQSCVTEAKVFILGDTSYGSCCVDEVGAQHYQADCVIHYGRACLSPTARLPVLYVFGRSFIDSKDCVEKIQNAVEGNCRVILMYDTTYAYAAGEIFIQLKKHFSHAVLSKLCDPSSTISFIELANQHNSSQVDDETPVKPGDNYDRSCCRSNPAEISSDSISISGPLSPDFCGDTSPLPGDEQKIRSFDNSKLNKQSVCKCGRIIRLPVGTTVDDHTFVFIGPSDSPALVNMMMTFNKNPFYTYNPLKASCERETLNINKALMKRYYLIERAKDANIVGIVAGTLGVAKYREMIDHLKELVKVSGKKSYTFVVGKLNPAKLANFAEVDIYVLVACPESSVLDQSDFYRPVVSPLEMELACNKARVWTGDYSADFRELLPGAADYVEAPKHQEAEEVDVSLISNKIRTLGARDVPDVGEPGQNTVALRSDSSVVANVAQDAGEFLVNRSWQGLERKLGETPVVKATEGQHGIAASYDNEPVS